MKISFEEHTYENVKDVLAGFITEGDEELKFNMVASPDLQFNTAMQLIMSISVNILNAFKEQHPEAKEDLYDAYNFMASSILNTIIPESELREDLDEAAILKAQEELIEEQYNKMSEEEKAIALEQIEKMRDRLTKDVNKEV